MQDDPARPAAQIPLAGVIGMPIAHSRSPRLHGFWLQRYGIAGHYMPLPVRAEHLADVLREVRGLGLMIGVELAEGIAAFADSKRPASVQIVERLHAAGLLTIPASARVFRLLPPLNISKQDADEGLAIIESVIKELAS